ncbi:MAG: class I SAM-dependent methyltransferase [Myxococcales bacterium]|nr:class I SAM-dependent methyltransferase [Myxococcales bacterium]
MRDNRPSLTARVVAFGRGVGLDERRRDPLASALLWPSAGAAFERVLASAWGGLLRATLRFASVGLVDHATWRMLAVDEVVQTAAPAQVVVLGAGLDTRAWRLDALRGRRVIEVDHPATQAWKRDRAASHATVAEELVWAAADFSRQSLDEVLAAAGHRLDAPTLWIWEGVTMYLPADVTADVLHRIARRSAPGSVLVMSYAEPLPAVFSALVSVAFRLIGEPLQGTMTSERARRLVREAGFEVVEEHGPPSDSDARRGYLLAPAFGVERLLVALRRQ